MAGFFPLAGSGGWLQGRIFYAKKIDHIIPG
jgi:hypothetical protein